MNPDIFKSDNVAKLCPVSYRAINHYGVTMRIGLISHLLGLISGLVACLQVNLAMLTLLHCDLEKQINFIISHYLLCRFSLVFAS